MYGMAGYSRMGPPVMQLGVGPYDYDTAGSSVDTKSGNSILDWINAGLTVGKTVVDTIQNKGQPVPVIRQAPPQQASILGMSPTTLLMVGGIVVVGTILLNRRGRR